MKKILLIDHHRCVGCRNCEMICSLTHEGVCAPSLSRIRVARDEREGWNVPISCSMCERPACVMVCPVGAAQRDDETGLTLIDENRCIGCLQCVQACPFGHADFNPIRGVAFKCDRCGGDPQCAKFCWTGAITYETVESALEGRRQETARRTAAE
ncbi:MAG: 4Fe-4S dicluster domain-containing protein [Syntrophomonadaceae bacterium]